MPSVICLHYILYGKFVGRTIYQETNTKNIGDNTKCAHCIPTHNL